MESEILKSEKDDIEVMLDNATIAEILRVYLNDNVEGVELAVWRREHPSKPVLLKIKTKGKTAKKAISEAIVAINKNLDGLVKDMKKTK